MFEYSFVLIALFAVFLLLGAVVAVWAKFYRKCPEGKLMVVWGPRPPGTFVIVDSGGRSSCRCSTIMLIFPSHL